MARGSAQFGGKRIRGTSKVDEDSSGSDTFKEAYPRRRSRRTIRTTDFNELIDFIDRKEAEIKEILKRKRAENRASQEKHGDSQIGESPERRSYSLADYWPLCRAIQENDWKGVENFVSKHNKALTAQITEFSETIFHKIVYSGAALSLVEKFAANVNAGYLEEKDSSGDTALSHAAIFGNTKAAKILVNWNKKLPNIRNNNDFLPIHLAAWFRHKETVQYLLSVTVLSADDETSCVRLLKFLISSNLFGSCNAFKHIGFITSIALQLLKSFPGITRGKTNKKDILEILAKKPLQFASGNRFGYWQNLIYHCIPVKDEHIPNHVLLDQGVGDLENPTERSEIISIRSVPLRLLRQIATKLCVFPPISMIWNARIMDLASRFKRIHDAKLTHMQAIEIVRIICGEQFWNFEEASESLKMPILTAAKLGIHEFVNEIIKAHFYSFLFTDENGHNIFKLAVLHRQEKVFKLVYKMAGLKDWVCSTKEKDLLPMSSETKVAGINDKSGNNILHLAAKSVPSSQVPGAALQMQRELQWFKVVESLFPSLEEQQNFDDKTAREMFTEEHKDLVKKGEKWMKETAQSCTVVAALIITVVFAAAFTVPGGNNNGGIPNFLQEPSFVLFVISDALALFSSTASVLMFLGILTSRYAEEDFLMSLPKKLIFGLITLFFSIASMMVAFAATFYIVLSHPWKWVIIPTALLGCLPVTLFALSQFPLVVEIFLSTYRPSIFQPK